MIMTKHNTWELSGSESVRYMKASNLTTLALWVLVLTLFSVLTQHFVAGEYQHVGAAESVRSFRGMLVWDSAYILVLSLVWWFAVTNEFSSCAGIRDLFERRTFNCAVVFSALALFGPVAIGLFGEFGIAASNGHFYPLHCPFIPSAVFICLMYLLPPVNIQKVIFPGKSRRELVAGLAGLAAVGLLITDFFI